MVGAGIAHLMICGERIRILLVKELDLGSLSLLLFPSQLVLGLALRATLCPGDRVT